MKKISFLLFSFLLISYPLSSQNSEIITQQISKTLDTAEYMFEGQFLESHLYFIDIEGYKSTERQTAYSIIRVKVLHDYKGNLDSEEE